MLALSGLRSPKYRALRLLDVYKRQELNCLSSEENDITVEEKGRTGVFAEGKELTGSFIESQSSETAEDDLTSIQRKVLTQILLDMLHEVQHCYLKWCTEGFEPFKDEYRSHMAFRGTRATLEALDGSCLLYTSSPKQCMN